MKKHWLKFICAGLALIILLPALSACSIFGGGNENGDTTAPTTVSPTTPVSTEVPVVEINRVAPNNLDLAGMTEVALATPGEGAMLVNEAARIWVPPGAVGNDTPVTIKTFIESPESLTSTVADATEVTVISNFYDLGPDNTQFKSPVTITLSYAQEDLPAGADENAIMPIYYNGVNWIAMERQLDTENNRVSFETTSFPGLPIVLALGYAVTGTAITASVGAIAYKTYSWWVKDPVYYGKAAEYVTPDDPTVQKYADMSTIKLLGSDTRFDIKDLLTNPNAVAALENNVDSDGYIGFIKFFDENNVEKPMTYHVSWNPDDWQKPADFFNNGMVGDCKNVANAVGSIVRYYGFPAKCMDGYTNGARHAWLEVKIGEKMYYVGSRGELMTLEGATKYLKLTRSVNKNGERFQWDEGGQKPYKENWWVDKLQVKVNSKMAFPGGNIGVEVGAGPGVIMDINLTLENPQKAIIAQDSRLTEPPAGKTTFTLDLPVGSPTGVYWVIAADKTGEISEPTPVSVDALQITGELKSTKVEPGEMLEINVRFNKPLSAEILVDNDALWRTDLEGSVKIVKAITLDAALGPYLLTLSSPEYGVSKTFSYAVWLPAVLKVNITPETVAPGGSFTVNVLIDPAQIARITMQGYIGEWLTGTDGGAHILVNVPQTAAPGTYQIVVKAPDLNLTASDTYTVKPAQTSLTLPDITVMAAGLTINCTGSDEESEWEAQVSLGGQFVRVSGVNNLEIFASGTVMTNAGPGEMYYTFTLNKELTRVVSGHVSLVTNGASYEFNVSDVPMDTAAEDALWENEGLDGLVFKISGTAVASHYGSLSLVEPGLGSIDRYFTTIESEIVIILVAATESQIVELLEE